MKFYADEMLGKLARWLRMCGMDVRYQNQVEDAHLLEISRKEKRVVLTRDTRLIKNLEPDEYLFISHDYLEDQFTEFFKEFPQLKTKLQPLSRCAECNTSLQEIQKSEVKDKVWPFVFQNQEKFTLCPQCDRIYWKATHVNKILSRLDRLLQPSEKT